METSIRPSALDDVRPETMTGMAISLAFWLCLIAAAVLFAAITLSPKFVISLQLRSQFDRNQLRLVSLEQHAGRLQKVIEAIRNDRDFSAELTRIEFDAIRPDEEVIPVDVALKLDARTIETPILDRQTDHVWYEPAVNYLASNDSVRKLILGTAALLVVFAFTLLQPAAAGTLASGSGQNNSVWKRFCSRYSSNSQN